MRRRAGDPLAAWWHGGSSGPSAAETTTVAHACSWGHAWKSATCTGRVAGAYLVFPAALLAVQKLVEIQHFLLENFDLPELVLVQGPLKSELDLVLEHDQQPRVCQSGSSGFLQVVFFVEKPEHLQVSFCTVERAHGRR